MDRIAFIEAAVVDVAGFFASYVVKKQLERIGATRETLTETQLGPFIDAVVENTIYDEKVRRELKRKLKKEFKIY